MTVISFRSGQGRFRVPFTLFLVPLLIPFFVNCREIFAQTPMATIFGTVRDQTGAMLEGVQVEIREINTQVVRSTVSGKSGTFVIPLLSPGRYRATASLSGFKKGIVEGLVLSVGDKVALNFVLQVGSV